MFVGEKAIGLRAVRRMANLTQASDVRRRFDRIQESRAGAAIIQSWAGDGGVMSNSDNQAYFLKRARQERARASASSDTAAALTHMTMAEEYERRAACQPDAISETALRSA
jgi:streptomycin 6-kinase